MHDNREDYAYVRGIDRGGTSRQEGFELRRDARARVPFALVAVMLLLFAGISAVYIARLNEDYRIALHARVELIRMENVAAIFVEELVTQADTLAMSAIVVATQSDDDAMTVNEHFNESFTRYMAGYNSHIAQGHYRIIVADYSVGLILAERSTYDIIVSNDTTELYMVNRTENAMPTMDLSMGGEYRATSRMPYYSVNGYINYTVEDTKTGMILSKTSSVERLIENPYPLLTEKLLNYQANSLGGTTDIGRLLRYMLTTVAQYRVLQGYGASGEDNGYSTMDILTPEDVELAVNLALLLEEMRLYRAIDQGAFSAFDVHAHSRYDAARAQLGASSPNIAAAERTMERLIEHYATEGTLDAADLCALYMCLDAAPVDMSVIFAQAIYALLDQFVLKYLDHLDISMNLAALEGFISKSLGWLGVELGDGEHLVAEGQGTEVGFDEIYYRTQCHKVENSSTYLDTFEISGAWQLANDTWSYIADNGTQLDTSAYLRSTVNLTLEASGYPMTSLDENDSAVGLPESRLVDPQFYVIDHGGSDLTFTHRLELGDNAYGELRVRDLSSDAWRILHYYNTSILDWSSEHVRIPDIYNGNVVQLAFVFHTNAPENVSGWSIENDVLVMEAFDGVLVEDREMTQTNYTVEHYSTNLVDNITDHVGTLVESIYDDAKALLTAMFQELARYISDMIVELLFGGSENYPTLQLEPTDERSLLDTLHVTVADWVNRGITELKSNLTNTASLIVNVSKRMLADVIVQLRSAIENALGSALENVSGWVSAQVDKIADVAEDLLDITVGTLLGWLGASDYYERAKDLVHDKASDFWETLEYKIRSAINGVLTIVSDIFNDTVDFAGELITQALHNVTEVFEGIIHSFLDALREFLVSIATWLMDGDAMTNTKFLQCIHYRTPGTHARAPFEFWKGEYEQALAAHAIGYEHLNLTRAPKYLALEDAYMFDTNPATYDQLSPPAIASYGSRYDHTPPDYKLWLDLDANDDGVYDAADLWGMHYTSPTNLTRRPFETTWNLSLYGEFALATRSESRVLGPDGTHRYLWKNDTVVLNISLTLVVYSGWGLDGVRYDVSNTLVDDIAALLSALWDKFTGAVSSVLDGLMKLVEFFTNIIGTLLNYAIELVRLVNDAMQFVVTCLQQFIATVLDGFIDEALDAVQGLLSALGGGDTFTFSAFGITFTVYLQPDFYDDNRTDELFAIATAGELFGNNIWFRLDVLDVSAVSTHSHYDIVVDGAIDICELDIELTIDPLMLLQGHILEGHGMSVDANGEGWGIDFYMPECESYEDVTYSLPVTPMPIPIPPLGVQAEVEVGVQIKYDAPISERVVINEFELDALDSEQWVELCNPSYEAISIDGWQLQTLNGEKRALSLHGSVPQRMGDDNGYLVFELPADFSDGASHGLLDIGNGFVLLDATGAVIDRTPMHADAFHDARTWQRAYDCGLEWVFATSTRNGTNPETPKLDIGALVWGTLIDCFKETWLALEEKPEPNLEFVAAFAQLLLRKFIDQLLSLIREIVIEVTLYIDVALSAIGTGAGGGVRLSFVMNAIGLEQLLRWLLNCIDTFIYNIGHPNSAQGLPSIPREVTENIFVRFEGYLNGNALPRSLQRVAGQELQGMQLFVSVQANLPAFAQLVGCDWGTWRIDFGVYLAGNTHVIAAPLFGTDETSNPDIWLLKASVYEVRGR